MFGRITYGEQRLLLNNNYISGLQNVSISNDFNTNPIYVAGIGVLKSEVDKAIMTNITLEQVMTNQDSVFDLVKNNELITGIFQHKDNIVIFDNAYITAYNLSCKVGEFVKASTQITSYGELNYVENTGQFLQFSGIPSGLKIADYSSILVGLNEAIVDRVIGFNLSIRLENTPIFGIGSLSPLAYKLKFPVEVIASFDLEIENSQLIEIKKDICSNYYRDVSIVLNARCGNESVASFAMSGACLKSQKYNGRIGANASISFEYSKYYNEFPLFIFDSGILETPAGRYVMFDSEYPNRIIPEVSTIKKVETYYI